MGNIEQYYNYDYDEWGRLERHRIEFEITRRTLDKFIPDRVSVLDVGGGLYRQGAENDYLGLADSNSRSFLFNKKFLQNSY